MVSKSFNSGTDSDGVRDWRPRHVRKEDIISTAAKLWAKNGYHGTSIADLCQATGMGKGALYHHIGSKEAILVEIYRRVSGHMHPFAEALEETGVPPGEALRRLSHEWMASITKHRDHYAVFFRETESLTGEAAKEVKTGRADFKAIVAGFIQRGIDSGEFASVDIDLAAMAFIGMHAWATHWLSPSAGNPYRWWNSAAERPSADDIGDGFSQVYLAGLEAR